MSLVEKICKELLGVEVGEKWIGDDGKHYRIIDTGKLIQIEYNIDPALDIRYFEIIDDISRVLTGKLKPAWKPKVGETYYTPDIYGIYESMYTEHSWTNELLDNISYNRRLVFKTKEEAIECANKMLELAKHGI